MFLKKYGQTGKKGGKTDRGNIERQHTPLSVVLLYPDRKNYFFMNISDFYFFCNFFPINLGIILRSQYYNFLSITLKIFIFRNILLDISYFFSFCLSKIWDLIFSVTENYTKISDLLQFFINISENILKISDF